MVIGLDVGKHVHHVCGLDPAGIWVAREVNSTEPALREVSGRAAGHGRELVVVNQLHSIGALPGTVVQGMGIDAAYLPGLSMRRLTDLHPGNAKTHDRDAQVIADAAMIVPQGLRSLDVPADAQADLAMLLGYDDDLARQITSAINGLRGLLVQIHPTLNMALGDNISQEAVLRLLITTGGPDRMRQLSQTGIDEELNEHAPSVHARLAEQIWAGLTAQTGTGPGTTATAKVLPRFAAQILQLRHQQARIARDVEQVFDDHPLAHVLSSMPGVGVKIAARLLAVMGSVASAFPTAARLAACASLSPVTMRSGSSIRGQHLNRAGNKRLTNVRFMAAFTSLRANPASKSFYDRNRAEGKKHNVALICVARHETDVLLAMIRAHQPYPPSMPTAARRTTQGHPPLVASTS